MATTSSKIARRAATSIAGSSRTPLASRLTTLVRPLITSAPSTQRKTTYIHSRPFSSTSNICRVHRPKSPGPILPNPNSDHEKDNETLRTLFDAPPSSTSFNPLRSSAPPTGLFEIPSLTTPQGFLTLAQQTLARAQLLVDRIDRAGSSDASTSDGAKELEEVVRNLDRLSDLLCGVIDMAELVRNAHPDPDWAEAANAAYEYLCGYMNVLNTHTGLYGVLKRILITPEVANSLSSEATAVAQVFLRDFEKSGIHLPPAERERFVQLSDEILVLGRGFLKDITGSDASDSFSQNASSKSDLDKNDVVEIPNDWLEDLNSTVRKAVLASAITDRDGLLTFSAPDQPWVFQTLLKYSPDSRVRKLAFRAANYGSSAQVSRLERLLRARSELATLTGASSYSEMALGDKMAKEPQNVEEFLRALTNHHKSRASKDLDKLRKLKMNASAQKDRTFNLSPSMPNFVPWDRELYTEQHFRSPSLRSVQPLSPYLSLGSVFAGLSKLFSALYGIRFRASTVAPGEVWSEGPGDVFKVEVLDEREGAIGSDGSAEGLIGTIYADLWSRDGKPGGAAHYTVRCSRRVDKDDESGDFIHGRAEDGRTLSPSDLGGEGFGNPLQAPAFTQRERPGRYQLPVVVLMCDFARPNSTNSPCLLGWHEVETLFHEMGHAIHSMIGRTSYHNVSGTRCATDFVELPSILMEHFVQSPQVVSIVARHHKTGASLPFEHLESHLQASKSLEGLDTYHQILLARLDQMYHSDLAAQDNFDSTQAYASLDAEMALPGAKHLSYVDGAHPQVRFGHLFGYGSTYYSYLLDRVIANKIWAELFAQNPLSREAGEVFKSKCLKFGGGKDPWHILADVVGAENVRHGDNEALRAVGKWGIE
ncbi:related to mitochondrial intermediate peptidase precursor [Melanopsichium pennsylvanicum]|uniref:mitochondrial intermediate peptidase n=2 Tax=Melanopsichium pennsylvanicum TaxID=63383 RepID=A0AAJ4XHB9_9BASI|nr:related to mitochondrial intermediate peptidase precursor [Melanopsichium pennsylvanicum 4]SNX82092.1 related to mitochondrial intermediate peptidase precursor [Melanopsichium pennsylvanicum]